MSAYTVVQNVSLLGKPLSEGFCEQPIVDRVEAPLIWRRLVDRCKPSLSVDIAIATRDSPSCGDQTGHLALGRYLGVSLCTSDGSPASR